jgi:hypothetical protein
MFGRSKWRLPPIRALRTTPHEARRPQAQRPLLLGMAASPAHLSCCTLSARWTVSTAPDTSPMTCRPRWSRRRQRRGESLTTIPGARASRTADALQQLTTLPPPMRRGHSRRYAAPEGSADCRFDPSGRPPYQRRAPAYFT